MSDVYRRRLAGGGELVVSPATLLSGLVVSLQTGTVAIGDTVSRDDVRDLVSALDDWLFDSRPR